MNEIELFFGKYVNSISALSAVSTFAAVMVSLLLAMRGEKTRMSVGVTSTFLIHDMIAPHNRPNFLSVSITNKGSLPLRVPYSFFCWKVPFCRYRWMISPLDSFSGISPFVTQKRYPVKIEPKHSESFFLSDKATFRSEMKKSLTQLPFPTISAYFIKAEIRADDGTKCYAKISKGIRQEIIKCAKATNLKQPI